MPTNLYFIEFKKRILLKVVLYTTLKIVSNQLFFYIMFHKSSVKFNFIAIKIKLFILTTEVEDDLFVLLHRI